jgi:hypothetical protein
MASVRITLELEVFDDVDVRRVLLPPLRVDDVSDRGEYASALKHHPINAVSP